VGAGSNADVVPVYVDVLDSIPRADPSEWPGAQLGPDIRIVGRAAMPMLSQLSSISISHPLLTHCVD